MSTEDSGVKRLRIPVFESVAALVGGVGFLAVQIPLLHAGLRGSSDGENMGWFLNAGTNVLYIWSAVVLAAALAVIVDRAHPARAAAMCGLGATAAMIGTLFFVGPGTIFPIVIVIGMVVIATAVLAGCSIAMGLTALSRQYWHRWENGGSR